MPAISLKYISTEIGWQVYWMSNLSQYLSDGEKEKRKNLWACVTLFINFYFTSWDQGDGTPRKAIYKALLLSDPWLPQAKYATHALIENQMFWDRFAHGLHVLGRIW